jgi:hypothetical protein
VRTSRGEADFEGVGGESKGLMREGRIGACHVKHGGCASRRSESEKENSRGGGRGWEGGSYSEVKSSDLPRRGDYSMPERGYRLNRRWLPERGQKP